MYGYEVCVMQWLTTCDMELQRAQHLRLSFILSKVRELFGSSFVSRPEIPTQVCQLAAGERGWAVFSYLLLLRLFPGRACWSSRLLLLFEHVTLWAYFSQASQQTI